MITAVDINGIYRDDATYNPAGGAIIHAKVAAAFPAGSQSHQIQCSSYNRIFFTSDIHADLRKFVQMLQFNQLINPAVDPYAGDIYDSRLISDSRWTGGPKTLVVIVGDLVDGQRNFTQRYGPDKYNSVDDTKGSFEFLLFALLFNLRLQARAEGSEILFTIGNHDLETIIRDTGKGFYTKYVHPTAKTFFHTNWNERSQAILPFLNACPFFMLGFYRDTVPEMACVHAGFHIETYGDSDRLEELEDIQRDADLGTSLNTIAMDNQAFLYDEIGVLFGRKYGKGACGLLGTFKFPFVVVGHCPTSFTSRPQGLIQTATDATGQRLYKGCDDSTGYDNPKDVGCIVTDCNDTHGAPKLAYVDIAMTKGFRLPEMEINNKDRLGQMMLLTHDPALQSNRYYNQIDRVAKIDDDGITKHSGLGAADGDDDTNTLMYKAPPVAAGPQIPVGVIGSPRGPANGFATTGGKRRTSRRTLKKQKKQKKSRRRRA